ncbi:SWIM zinc finger family protein [Lusitaniella coriacea LEGE 07157]|uniref:SWIM zinc finger family protein n=1 Tax=Lusitaniella coriacea LEGE 07157 TaxID=945747 RepID=A0A8J7DVJ9_9CYAN|nr:SWIM zinc finger family protein [Lusitaniella coriacea]MBE9115851.1 SWIM zinc finger family protein [Lusitaniella coriacea LEGE 07157]
MGEFSRTWWGQKFISAIETFTDSARLGRGRSYARGGKILKFSANEGKIEATVRGSINPYFGVYKEPRYRTEIAITPIPQKDWTKIIQRLSTNASFVSKLLLNEVPENIETSFLEVNKNLLPHTRTDLKTKCSCPDYSNPCKHIAGLCYRFAAELDEDPFLLFELRGISKEALQEELITTPLGKALIAGLGTQNLEPEPAISYYTEVQTELASPPSLKDFWLERQQNLSTASETIETNVAGILVKKQGDFPSFWRENSSFIEVMEELYQRVRTKNREIL